VSAAATPPLFAGLILIGFVAYRRNDIQSRVREAK
jgi:hypothetical protein